MITEILAGTGAAAATLAVSLPTISHLQKKKNKKEKTDLQDTISHMEESADKDHSRIQELEEIAYKDPITGLNNMAKFSIDCREMIEKYPESNFGIIIFEIDNLNKINISYGLQECDKVRCFVADYMRSLLKTYYIYGRVHEQLFAVLANYDEDDELVNVIDLISSNLKDYSKNFQVHMSFGIYRIEDKSMQISAMVNLAELAKRTITKNSDSNYAFYTHELEQRLIEDDQIGAEMNHALEHHQFIMYMQPMVNLRTHEVIGGEALVRWNHPTRGILSPFRFIPLFEANNFIIKLDHYIWSDAFKTIRHWIDNNVKPVPIHINISPIHFDHPGFVDTLNGYAAKFKVPKEFIVLEFPERAFSETTDEIKAAMNRLSEDGFPICIDNFGSYHSPINLLKDLPISIIKLDRNFLSRSLGTENGATIVRYLNAMTKELGKTVIAEGVETSEQTKELTEIGCDYAQGFFFAKPLPLREFDEFHAKLLSAKYMPTITYPTFEDGDKSLLP